MKFALLAIGLLALGACQTGTSYDEPDDFVGCRQAALDHEEQLGTLLEQVVSDCAKKDPAGYEEWLKTQPKEGN
jgi:hypothetical protein